MGGKWSMDKRDGFLSKPPEVKTKLVRGKNPPWYIKLPSEENQSDVKSTRNTSVATVNQDSQKISQNDVPAYFSGSKSIDPKRDSIPLVMANEISSAPISFFPSAEVAIAYCQSQIRIQEHVIKSQVNIQEYLARAQIDVDKNAFMKQTDIETEEAKAKIEQYKKGIPLLEQNLNLDAPLNQNLPSYCLQFLNGVYNLKMGEFFPSEEKGRFAVDCNFVASSDKYQLDFDKLMYNTFCNFGNRRTNDEALIENKIRLVYQIIGAILSNFSLKNIFVFQGVGNSGKTTLAEIICDLLGEQFVISKPYLTDISEDSRDELNRYKLLFIEDAADK